MTIMLVDIKGNYPMYHDMINLYLCCIMFHNTSLETCH